MQIQQIRIDELIPYARNARTHSAAQVAEIAASIKEFGFNNPVLLRDDKTIIAGHGRVQAALKLGMEAVPCIYLSHLTENQARAYVLADNQLATHAGWEVEMLRLELDDLGALGFDPSLLGFGDDDLREVLGAATQGGLTDPDDAPAVQAEAVTKPGDVWILGKHRLMCGDSTDAGCVALLMKGEKAALLHADPPYGMGKESEGVANDNLHREKLDAFQIQWWRTCRQWLEDNASAYIWGTAPDLWRLWYVGGLADSERLTLRNEITWDKKNSEGMGVDGGRKFPTASERCLFFMLGEQGFNSNADNYWEGWEPIRAYLAGEMKRAGWTIKDLNRITGTNMGGHWVNKSQWQLVTAEHYAKIQAAARDHDAFKREHDELKREFYATRAYFDNAHESMRDVWEFTRVNGDARHGHATPKPVAMIERIMKSSLPPDGLSVEPFSGSGTTLIAAEQTGRICYAMELSPLYVDVAVRRWQNFTGQLATLEATGEPFPPEVTSG